MENVFNDKNFVFKETKSKIWINNHKTAWLLMIFVVSFAIAFLSGTLLGSPTNQSITLGLVYSLFLIGVEELGGGD